MKTKQNKSELLLLIIVIIFFSIYLTPYNNIISMIDTGSYIEVSKNIFSAESKSRPPIFPTILSLGSIFFNDNGSNFTVLLHWIVSILWIILFWDLLNKINIHKYYQYATLLVFFLSPRILLYKHIILPEYILSFIIFLVFYMMCNILLNKPTTKSLIFIGLLNSVVCLLKPIWLFGGILTFMFSIYHYWDNKKFRLYYSLLPLAVNVILVLTWQLFLFINFNQFKISNISNRNLNLISIRAGYYNDGYGCDLYKYIESEPTLLSSVKTMNWKNFEQFTFIKNNINETVLTNDDKFYAQAISKNLSDFIKNQVKRIPTFFNSKCLTLYKSKFISKSVELNYLRFYKIIYLFIIPYSFIIGSCYLIINRNQIGLIAFLYILYYSTVCVFLTYQDQIFVRMRTGIDSLLFIFPLIFLNSIQIKKNIFTN